MADPFDAASARANLRATETVEIGAALLDQSLVAGIGNVYKSEVLFLCGLSPFRRVADLDDATLDRVLATAHREMRRNLDTVSRPTRGAAGKHWVYRRSLRPCRRCGTTIERRVQGDPPRSTYFCPGCQGSR
jgi:endonuclease-8